SSSAGGSACRSNEQSVRGARASNVAGRAGSVTRVAAPSRATPARRWPRRLLIGVCAFVALCVVLAGSGYAYLRWRFSQVHKIAVPGLKEDKAGESRNVLLIGNASRAN